MPRYAKKSMTQDIFSAPANAPSQENNGFTEWLDSRLHGLNMFSETVTVSPAFAEYILKRCNTGNRRPVPSAIDQYAKDMREKKFQLTAQSVSFTPEGVLNNGQNRLMAVIRSKMTVKLYMTFNETREAFYVTDTGSARGGRAALHILGMKDAAVLAASARVLQNILTGVIAQKYTNKELIDIVTDHPTLSEAVSISAPIRRKFPCPSASAAVACYFILTQSKSHPDELTEFVRRLVDGNDLGKNSRILKLRDGLGEGNLGGELKRITGSAIYDRTARIAASIIMAWNLHRLRRTSGNIVWSDDKPFPDAV